MQLQKKDSIQLEKDVNNQISITIPKIDLKMHQNISHKIKKMFQKSNSLIPSRQPYLIKQSQVKNTENSISSLDSISYMQAKDINLDMNPSKNITEKK